MRQLRAERLLEPKLSGHPSARRGAQREAMAEQVLRGQVRTLRQVGETFHTF